MTITTSKAYYAAFTSPLGTGYVASTEKGVCRVELTEDRRDEFLSWLAHVFGRENVVEDSAANAPVLRELAEYFAGRLSKFTCPLDLRGTEFQRKVWAALLEIPYGKTASYRDIAVAIGKPAATRAVGSANHANPVPVIVPCHRVIGANGDLVGYGGGLGIKRYLLGLEGALAK
ncbi:MAG: methylated-DNA--[protein]-cysteine S-methyltransferase [Syntrophothermus sp.]